MSETRKKLGAAKTLMLGGVVGVALVAACDTPIPTEVQEALVDAMVDENGQAVDAETEASAEVFLRGRIPGTGPLPIIYLDGVRVDRTPVAAQGLAGPADNEEGTGFSLSGIASLDPDAIERVEVLKGAAAAALYGSEAENGVIQIFTKGGSTLRVNGETLLPGRTLTDAAGAKTAPPEGVIPPGVPWFTRNITIVGTDTLVPAKRRH